VNTIEQSYMSVEQSKRFLAAIPEETRDGMRDRAIFVLALMTGAPLSEIRQLRRYDVKTENGIRYVMLCRRWMVIPDEAWQALEGYLRAVNRWNQPSGCQFLFSTNDGASPLAGQTVIRRARAYALAAGINPDEVTAETFPRSAVALMVAADMSPSLIHHQLGYARRETTDRFLEMFETARTLGPVMAQA
jgi:integrase